MGGISFLWGWSLGVVFSVFWCCSALGDVHAFYYAWYRAPPTDEQYGHWNHRVLEHWDERTQQAFDRVVDEVRYVPPGEVHAPFYPYLGPYSSRNSSILREHMKWFSEYDIDVAVVSWWGRPTEEASKDGQGVGTDEVIGDLLDAAEEFGTKVAFHLEPYVGRTVESVALDLEYLCLNYGSHASVARLSREDLLDKKGKSYDSSKEILVYIYDSYHIPSSEWKRLLTMEGDLSLHGKAGCEVTAVGLWTKSGDGRELKEGGFAGGYTYFASARGGTPASNPQVWGRLNREALEHNIGFLPTASPGYDDRRIRPWNQQSFVDRRGGQQYVETWKSADRYGTSNIMTVTSFNEMGEGTNIEPSVPHQVPNPDSIPQDLRDMVFASPHTPGFTASSNLPVQSGPFMYLELTKHLASQRHDLHDEL